MTHHESALWINTGLIVLVIAVIVTVLIKWPSRKKQAQQEASEAALPPYLESKGLNDKALQEKIKQAGAEAVAASHGEPYQAELLLTPKGPSATWQESASKSFQQRMGKAPRTALSQYKPDHAEEIESKAQKIFTGTPKKTIIKPQLSNPEGLRSTSQFLTISLMAPRRSCFISTTLHSIFQQQRLQLTENQVYECFTPETETLFYVCTTTPQGTFGLNANDHYEVPGLRFIIDLKKTPCPKMAFKQMLALVDLLKNRLDGDVLDEHRRRFNHDSLHEYLARIKSTESRRHRKVHYEA